MPDPEIEIGPKETVSAVCVPMSEPEAAIPSSAAWLLRS